MESTTKSDIELPPRNLSQRWRRYSHDAKRRVFERFSKWCPKGTATSNLFIYLKTDQTFPEFVLKSVIGFFGGIVLTYLCFVFFVFQLSISLIHATIMSSIIGVLLTFGLAFSYRIRCLVFLLIPQLFSRVGRYTLTCYALILILTGPATNTLKNSEVLTESMACTQEQIKTDVKQITDSVKKPLSSMRDAIKLTIKRLNEISYRVDVILAKINRLVISIVDVLQSSYIWLYTVIEKCNERFGTPYDHCIKVLTYDDSDTIRNNIRKLQGILNNNSFIAKTVCSAVNFNSRVCNAPDYLEESIAATIKRKLRTFTNRVKAMFFIKIHMHHSYTFTSNSSRSPSQVTAGIVTEIRNRADPLLTWLSWSSCITSLFLLLIIFRAKYYQHMFETRSRFDNRYITKELRDLDLQRLQEGKETVLPLNRRERAKYVTTTSFRLVATEKFHLTRSIVFMTITTFKLMIHMIADYSLYWVLTTIRYHGKRQTQLPPGPMEAGLVITGTGLIVDLIRAIFKALLSPLLESPSPISCLPKPYPPDLKRYAQIGVLIFLLWFFALFEPYGLRLRHLIMGHYRPERAKARAAWLYNHILRTRGSFMKFARRKIHKEFKYLPQENLTFRHWLRTRIPCQWLRCILGITPIEQKCLLCYARELQSLPNSDLIRCETQNCPGTYCNSCFTDIGRLCTICLSPVDYGDFSDISLEKGSSDDSEDSSKGDTTNLLPKRKYFFRARKSRDKSIEPDNIGNIKKSNPRNIEFCSSNEKTPLLYSSAGETLDFTNLGISNNILTVGFVYHNYFCDNLTNISTNMFKTYNDIDKHHTYNKKFEAYYGSIEKPLNIQQLKEIKLNKFNETKLLQKKPTSPKGKQIDIIDRESSIGTHYNITKKAKLKKRPRKKFKLPSKIITVKRKYSQNINTKRKNKKMLCFKRNLSKTLCLIRSSMSRITNRLGSRNIKLNLYNIKNSSSTIIITKIIVDRKIRHRRKGLCGKPNDLQKDRHCTNNANNTQLEEKNNKPDKKDNLPLRPGNEDAKDKEKLNIFDNTKEIPNTNTKKTHLKNCLSIKKIRKLISDMIIVRCTLNKICYAQKKTKVKSFRFLKYKHNYKRRKKYHNKIKENSINKTRKIRNDMEMTRKYRIYSFLNEGDWIKGPIEIEDLQPEEENKPIAVNNAEEECVDLSNYIEEIGKSRIPNINKDSFCNCNCKKNSEAINDSEANNKWSEKSIYHTHLPVLSKSGHSYGEIGNNIFGHIKLSSSVKSFSIKNVKMYITNKFLHVKFGNPITVLKTFLSTISFAKDKVSTPEIILRDNKNTVDKDVTAAPIVKPCTCQCEIINDISQQPEQCLPSLPKLSYDQKVDKQTQTETKFCTCATQYTMNDMKSNNYDSFINDLFKGYEKFDRRKDTKSFTSDSTRTDTTLCSCVTIDFVDEAPKVKNKRADRRIKVITKSNQSTATDKTNLRNASTVTSDWWSPIVEKKEINCNRDRVYKKKREAKPAKIINKRLVTFKSRTQIIPDEGSYVLSPSRYLLESQKYYNELYSPRFHGPHLFPVNRSSRIQTLANVSTNRINKNHRTKRLEKGRSFGNKLNSRRLSTRSDETFSIIH